ncbi:MAG: dipicolinate synthase subunit DpsA [Firmicutes bacterium]|nr:dipicolinate synthase subunit DpsA [Bacillota bacterium]
MDSLRGEEIVIVGGDRRELELYRVWEDAGLRVKAMGFELTSPGPQPVGAGPGDLSQAGVLVFPLPGIKGDGTVYAPFAGEPLEIKTLIKQINPRSILLVGAIAPGWQSLMAGYKKLILTATDEGLAIRNAIPTAEGAIQKAMEIADITIHGSRVLVLGFGRCGSALARALQGLGAEVSVLVRRRESEALAINLGFKAIFREELAEAVAAVDFIFNTVPALMLPDSLLKNVQKETIILDLASSPGGTDFPAAARRGIKALLLPALPGRVAPRSSGRLLAGLYPRIIKGNR